MSKERSTARNRLELALVEAFRLLLRLLPERGAIGLGRALGRTYRLADGRRRRITERNLSLAFPELPPDRIGQLSRDVFAHFGSLAAFLVRSLSDPLETLLSRVTVSGAEHPLTAAASGRGAFFLTPHLGNWEYAAIAAAAHGLPVTIIARPLDNPLLETRLKAFREQSGNRVVPRAQAAREMLRVLRAGGAIGILPDQHARPPDVIWAPFFGRPAPTTSSIGRMAARTGALVVPAFCVAEPQGRFRLEFLPPVDIEALPESERTPEAFTARINAIVEEMVRRYPSQWLWLHDRWRA